MIDHTQLKKGARIIMDGQPYEILESMPMKKAQRRVVIQARIKSLINGAVSEKNFHQGDVFEEAELEKFQTKFLYSHNGKYVFCEINDPSKRFEFTKEQIIKVADYLKPNQIVDGFMFEEKIVDISLPIKIQLKVVEAPPNLKGDTAQGGTKSATLETGKEISVPLFVEEGDTVEINTETGEYVRRV
jgi:elongation factor P